MASTKQASPRTDPSSEVHETESDAEDEQEDISKDELFHVLQNERRRRVLTYLLDNDGPFEMRAIAEQVAAWEHDTTVRQLMSDERQRVYIALYQSHLPKLDEVGLIDYEQKRGIVEPTELLETVSQYVDPPDADATEEEADGEDGDTGSQRIETRHAYMSVTAISFLLTGGAWLQSLPLFSGVEVAMAVTALFALTTAGLAMRHEWV